MGPATETIRNQDARAGSRSAFILGAAQRTPRVNQTPINDRPTVPLVGAEAWVEDGRRSSSSHPPGVSQRKTPADLIAQAARPTGKLQWVVSRSANAWLFRSQPGCRLLKT